MAAPAAKLWPHWQQQDPESSASIDHGAWDKWLGEFVTSAADGITRVDYAGVSTVDRARLRDYIDSLADIPILIVGCKSDIAADPAVRLRACCFVCVS